MEQQIKILHIYNQIKAEGIITEGYTVVAQDTITTELIGNIIVTDLHIKSAWAENLFVDPNYRNKGIGTELLTKAMDLAREHNCVAISGSVDKDMKPQRHLYEGLDWFLSFDYGKDDKKIMYTYSFNMEDKLCISD